LIFSLARPGVVGSSGAPAVNLVAVA